MSWTQHISFTRVLGVSALVRIALIVYAEWHDAHSVVKYTDVDYRVFGDATRFILDPAGGVAQGPLGSLIGVGDPYRRETYRYTPLLALLLIPNEWIHPAFGKALFSLADLIAGILVRRILLEDILPYEDQAHSVKDSHGPSSANERRKHYATILAAVHLLNPLVFAISTRGSSEALLLLLILLALRSATRGAWTSAAAWIGVAAHWKIYPAVYSIACVAALGYSQTRPSLVSVHTIRFGLIAATTFFGLGAGCYAVWGSPFLQEAYLYHVGRRDHRHNFAPHFYLTYLASAADDQAGWLKSPLIGFLPQLSAVLGTGLLFGRHRSDLPFAWFVQTACFVLFNKVCTSQYFLWYLVFLPLLAPRLRRGLSMAKAATLLAAWAGAQALWLAQAYKLEFVGENVFLDLWARGCVYIMLNVWVLGEIVKAYCVSM